MAPDEAEHVVRMLIVDDEADMRLLMRVTLDVELLMNVTAEATDGDEAVAAWRSHKPDVIVMDMRMPRMSGLLAAEEILAADPDQAIIMCSAYLDSAERDRATAMGIRECLDKYDIAGLPDAVRRAAAPND